MARARRARRGRGQHVVQARPPSSSPPLAPWPRRSSASAAIPAPAARARRSRRGSPCGCPARARPPPPARRAARPRAGRRDAAPPGSAERDVACGGRRGSITGASGTVPRSDDAARSGAAPLGSGHPGGAPVDRRVRPRGARRGARHAPRRLRRGRAARRPRARYREALRGARTRASRSSTPARPTSARRCCAWSREEGLSVDVASGGELYAALQAGFPPRAHLHARQQQGRARGRRGARGRRRHDDRRQPRRDRPARRARRPRGARASACWCGSTPGVEALHPLLHLHRPARLEVRLLDRGRPGRARRSTPCAAAGALELDGPALPHRLAALRPRRLRRGRGDRGRLRGLAERRRRPGRDGHGRGPRHRLHPRRPPGRPSRTTPRPWSRPCGASGGASACRCRASWSSPGRSIVGRAGVTLYRVGRHEGRSPGVRTYASVDGGMSDLLRPMLYGAVYEPLLANRADAEPTQTLRLVGKHCESGDVLVPEASLPPVGAGDLVCLPATGAYGVAMASNYNGVTRPAVVFVDGGARPDRDPARDLRRPGRPGRVSAVRARPGAPVRIGLLGCGTVGQAVVRTLIEGARHDRARLRPPPRGGPDPGARPRQAAPRRSTPRSSPPIPARGARRPLGRDRGRGDGRARARPWATCGAALARGASVVTANKQLLSRHGPELLRAAEEAGAELRFEASACAAIPVIKVLRESLLAAEIERRHRHRQRHHQLHPHRDGARRAPLRRGAGAGRRSWATPRPTPPRTSAAPTPRPRWRSCPRSPSTRGCSSTTCPTRASTASRPRTSSTPRALGFVVKLLGVARLLNGAVSVRVYPALVPRGHRLAAIGGPDNAVLLESRATPARSCWSGPGAGGDETASAVLADILSILGTHQGSFLHNALADAGRPIAPPGAVPSAFYVRTDGRRPPRRAGPGGVDLRRRGALDPHRRAERRPATRPAWC